jgi:hypothetical protein
MYPPYQLLNALINIYENWYLYHESWAALNGVFHKSVTSVCVYTPIVARKRLGKHVPAATGISNNRRIVWRVLFYAFRVISKESLWACLCIRLLLLDVSVNVFPRQRIVGGVVFYVILIVLKGSERFLPPRNSCLNLLSQQRLNIYTYIRVYNLFSWQCVVM